MSTAAARRKKYQEDPVARERMLLVAKRYYERNREKLKEYSREYRANHLEAVLRVARETAKRKRLYLICRLGGECRACGEKDPIVLDFDHIMDGTGAKDRKRARTHTMNLVKKTPERFQLLCRNCNWRKHIASLGATNASIRANLDSSTDPD